MTSTSNGLREIDIAREAALLEAESSVGNLRFDGEKVGAHLGIDNESQEYEYPFLRNLANWLPRLALGCDVGANRW